MMPIDHNEFMRCYNQQMTDEEICAELNVTFSMVANHRKYHKGLKKWTAYTKNLCKYKNPITVMKFEELYEKGKYDTDIARILSVSVNLVYRMRQERGWVSNRKKGIT